MSGQLRIIDRDGVPALPPQVAELSAAQLRPIFGRIREMVRYVDSVSEAVLLVRRASAAGRVVDEALKSCRLILGISKYESHRWQRIGTLPEERFEGHIRDCRQHRRELTTSSVLALASRLSSETDDEGGDGEDRPSGADAQFREYEVARGHLSNMIWLDPFSLARALEPVARRQELDRLRRWRIWLDEFELALTGGVAASENRSGHPTG